MEKKITFHIENNQFVNIIGLYIYRTNFEREFFPEKYDMYKNVSTRMWVVGNHYRGVAVISNAREP